MPLLLAAAPMATLPLLRARTAPMPRWQWPGRSRWVSENTILRGTAPQLSPALSPPPGHTPTPRHALPSPPSTQAQTAELRSAIDGIKTLAAALEGGGGSVTAPATAAEAAGALTVADLRQELRSFADTLHE